jgi:hypothetical protein
MQSVSDMLVNGNRADIWIHDWQRETLLPLTFKCAGSHVTKFGHLTPCGRLPIRMLKLNERAKAPKYMTLRRFGAVGFNNASVKQH